MASRAIIEEIIDAQSARVRIPTYNGSSDSSLSTPFKELSIATIVAPNGITPNYKVGDIVFVDFEDNDLGKPIIVGSLNLEDRESYNSDMSSDILYIDKEATLPQGTRVGDITYSEMSKLQGVQGNIQESLIDLDHKISLKSVFPFEFQSSVTSSSYEYKVEGKYIEYYTGIQELIFQLYTRIGNGHIIIPASSYIQDDLNIRTPPKALYSYDAPISLAQFFKDNVAADYLEYFYSKDLKSISHSVSLRPQDRHNTDYGYPFLSTNIIECSAALIINQPSLNSFSQPNIAAFEFTPTFLYEYYDPNMPEVSWADPQYSKGYMDAGLCSYLISTFHFLHDPNT